jgi:AcrR family transcriptional regulator
MKRLGTVEKTERRQQILSIAREVFAKRGYHATKIDDIVAAAKVARGTFYLYFEDKRSIFEEIVDRAFTRLGMVITRVDTAGDVASQVKDNVRRIVAVLLEDRATTKILLSDAVGLDPAFDRKLLVFYEEALKLLEESIREGQELGIVLPGNARIYAVLAMGALKEMLYQVVMRDLDLDEEQMVEALYELFSRGFLKPAAK